MLKDSTAAKVAQVQQLKKKRQVVKVLSKAKSSAVVLGPPTRTTTTTTTTTTTNKGTVKLLPDAALVARSLDDFGPYDILCGRCKQAFNNCGNRRFRITISLFLKKYLAAKSRTDKSELIISIVRYLRGPVGVRFLKPIKGPFEGYVEIGESGAREKVGHALRDLTVTVHHTTIAELREAESKARPPVLIPRKKKKQKTVRFQSYDDQGSTESNKLDQDKDEEEAQSTETEAEELSTDKEEDERQSPVRGDGEDPDTENKEEEPQSPVRADEAESSSMESNQYDYYDCQEKEGGHEVRHEIRYKEPSKPAHDDDDPELYEATLSLFLATYGNRRQTFTM
mmetsp:Transcript_18822/g.29181  ORF Transcript_18822/g.29181 Transcript_18822/m.29181 type:complete len:339 (-) Transcript_18822:512-1528(-)